LESLKIPELAIAFGVGALAALILKSETSYQLAAVPSSNKIVNMGGDYMRNAKLVLVYWGSKWKTNNNPSMSALTTAIQSICSSPYFSRLSQYGGIQRPTVLTNFLIQGYPDPPARFSLPEIMKVLNAKIPVNLRNPNNVIILCPHNGTVVTNNVNAWGTGSFHYPLTWTNSKQKNPIIAVFGEQMNAYTKSITHELVETLTNPTTSFPKNGFVSTTDDTLKAPQSDEIADICSATDRFDNRINGHLVLEYYSNIDGRCLAPGALKGPPLKGQL